MTELTRRHVLAGTAAAALRRRLPIPPANAAAPLAGTQSAGLVPLQGRQLSRSPSSPTAATRFKFPDGLRAQRQEARRGERRALEAAHYAKGHMTIPYNADRHQHRLKLVVIDTGTGEANFERSKGVGGQFQTNLKAAGIDRNAVDMVIISHFHGDHINGLITPDKKLAVSQRRDPGAGGGVEVLHGRRRDEPQTTATA